MSIGLMLDMDWYNLQSIADVARYVGCSGGFVVVGCACDFNHWLQGCGRLWVNLIGREKGCLIFIGFFKFLSDTI